MHKKISRYLLIVIGLGMLCFLPQEAAAQVEEYVSPEQLLFEEVPIVFSSAKREQLITEAASTVEIITAEDIKLSGAIISPAEALKHIPGIWVRQSFHTHHEVSVRGLSDRNNKHVLVTLDGNNIFIYHVNVIWWDGLPFSMQEIDHIEVIKGPGAIFYGGNAFSGVVNFVTKKPEQINGTSINTIVGTHGTQQYDILHGGSYQNLDYKIAGGHREAATFTDRAVPAASNDNFGISLYYHLDDETTLSFMHHQGWSDKIWNTSRPAGSFSPDDRYVSLRYDRPDFWGRFFWNHHYKPSPIYAPTYITVWEDDNYEIEAMQILRWGDNTTSIGAYAKRTYLNQWREGFIPEGDMKCDTNAWAINAENEYRATEKLFFTLGGRLEYHSVLKDMYLGRASAVYNLFENHSLRASISTGYYVPSLMDFYGATGGNRPANLNVKEEKITQYELSYFGTLTENIKLTANIFHTIYEDMLKNAYQTPGHPTWYSPANDFDGKQWGTEIGFNFLFTEWLTGFANHSYTLQDRTDRGELQIEPMHMLHVGLKARFFEKFTANCFYDYIGPTSIIKSNDYVGRVPVIQNVDAHGTVDVELSYQADDDVEISVIAQNIFDDTYIDYSSAGIGEEVRANAVLRVTYAF
ncbi:MAG: TonB-dependent receptor [Candidatus Omnitrophota bacterium]